MALNILKIPLSNIPQTFDIEMNGKAYSIKCRYNTEMASWLLSMADGDTGADLFDSMPLVAGVNLLAQYAHIGLDGSLMVYTDGDELAPPTLENLGVECNLYYLVEQ